MSYWAESSHRGIREQGTDMGGTKNQVWEGCAVAKCYRLGELLVEATISSPYYFVFLGGGKKSHLIIKEMSNLKSLKFIDYI